MFRLKVSVRERDLEIIWIGKYVKGGTIQG